MVKSIKAVTINDEWLQRLSQTQDVAVTRTDSAYAKIPLIYQAVKIRCDTLTSIPVHVYEGKNELEDWPYSQSLKKILWHTEASHLLKGGAVWVKLRNRYNLDKGIQVLNPFTVQIQWDYTNQERTFSQVINGKTYGPWSESEVVFWREYNPIDDIAWGTAAAEVALGDSQIMHYLSRFQREFFKSGAMPAVLLGLENASTVETDRVQGFFDTMMKGVQKAWRGLALSGKINPVVITPTFKDMALPEVRAQAFNAIVQAFGIPQTLLMGNEANYATAQVDAERFITKTIKPRCNYYEEGVNEFLEPTGIHIEFGVDELSEMQEDETMRATAYAGYVSAGMPEEVARVILGIDIPPDVLDIWEEYIARKKDEATTPPPSPDNQPEMTMNQNEAIRAWQRKSLKRLQEGKSPAVEFVTDDIPLETQAAIKVKLLTARTREEVTRCFIGD